MADTQLHADIAGVRADLQATNKNMERLAIAFEKVLDDHEIRLRSVEMKQVATVGREEIQTLRDFMNKMLGIALVINFVGLAGVAYLIVHAGVK